MTTPEPLSGEALHHDPFCRCGHKKNLHAGADAAGRCVKRSCGCGRYEQAGPANAPEPEQAAAQPDDPFGGHEFAYESRTDLFRCIKCHAYEVTARAGDTIKPCPGQPPAGAEPIEVNAW